MGPVLTLTALLIWNQHFQNKEKGGTSYVYHPYNYSSNTTPQKNEDTFCAMWSILINLLPVKTNVSPHRTFELFFNTLSLGKIYSNGGLPIKDTPKSAICLDFCVFVFEVLNTKESGKSGLYLYTWQKRKKVGKSLTDCHTKTINASSKNYEPLMYHRTEIFVEFFDPPIEPKKPKLTDFSARTLCKTCFL